MKIKILFLHSTVKKYQYLCKGKHINITIMPQMINNGNEMLRISTKGIEFSANGGRTWIMRYSLPTCGTFIDLLPYGSEVLAVTSKGIYFSKNEGRTWAMRYSLPTCGDFYNLIDGGCELLANTSKGLYFSTNSGRTWSFRKK